MDDKIKAQQVTIAKRSHPVLLHYQKIMIALWETGKGYGGGRYYFNRE